jgi:hypothetical protein
MMGRLNGKLVAEYFGYGLLIVGAAFTAPRHGKYEQAFAALFNGTCQLDKNSLNRYLKGIGASEIIGSRSGAAFEQKVKQDQAFGNSFGVRGTPTFFVLARDGKLTEVSSVNKLEDVSL